MDVYGDVRSHTSDYFQQIYELCLTMIRWGNAYADDTEQERVCYFLHVSLPEESSNDLVLLFRCALNGWTGLRLLVEKPP